jgi:hypothetical protein
MGFRESLPANCPPIDAHDGACACAFRFVSTPTPVAADFDSYAAQNKPIPTGIGVCPCRWASCSLYADLATVEKKRKLKSLRKYRFAARLTIREQSGYLKEDSGHIDFWMYDTFDPVAAIVETTELGDG